MVEETELGEGCKLLKKGRASEAGSDLQPFVTEENIYIYIYIYIYICIKYSVAKIFRTARFDTQHLMFDNVSCYLACRRTASTLCH